MRNLILFILLALAACDSDETVERISILQETEIGEEESVLVQDDKNGISYQLKVVDIADSRCPENANCVTLGSALVEFSITGNENITLCIGQCANEGIIETDSAVFRIDEVAYYLKLHKVVPYPVIPEKGTKKAVISVLR